MLRKIRFRVLAPAVAVLLLLTAPVRDETVLKAGSVLEQDLAGGEAHLFRLEGPSGQNLLVTVIQDGIDVAITLRKSDGSPLGTVDGAEERHGFERFLVSLGEEAASSFEIHSRFADVPKGRCRIEVQEVVASAPELAAERLMTEADLLASQEAEKPRRQALEVYGNALESWREEGRKQDQARTLLRMAVVHQELGKPQPMLDSLEEALSLYAAMQDRAGEADTLNYLGLAQQGLGRYPDALISCQKSLEIRRFLGDRHGEAIVSQNICLTQLHLGEWLEAIRCYEKVIPVLEEVKASVAGSFNGLGGAYSRLGEPRKARDYYERALKAERALQNRAGAASLLNNLAALAADQGILGDALGYYGEALEVYRQLGDRGWEARILNNLGHAYLTMGEPRRARDFFAEALPIRREVKDRTGEVNTLDSLGLVYERLGETAKALETYGEALRIAREAGNRGGEAATITLLAQAKVKAGDSKSALQLFGQAVELQRERGSRGGLALALQWTGEVEALLKQPERARITLREALELYRLLEDRPGQAETLASLAAVERDLGRFDEALGHAEESLAFVESVRVTVGDPGLRASFLASQRLAFELAIGLRMDLDRKQPDKGHAGAALALSERARARSLLDLLNEAGTDIRRGLDSRLRERDENLAYRFSVNARRQRDAATDEQRMNLQRELPKLLAEADLLENEIRKTNPRYAALIQPIDAVGIRGLLDPETLLLEYSLGEDRSFLWAVTPDRVDGFELPGRGEIDKAARQVYEDIRRVGSAGQLEGVAFRTLSRILLGPVAERLGAKRLVIVPDGALGIIPFAVLPDPRASLPLIVGHEIVSLPSASVLDMQRKALARRPRAKKAVAIFADPVFASWDSRLRMKPGIASPPPAHFRSRLQRLPATGREAEAIAALLPSDQVLVALGLQASRRHILSSDLTNFRVVHFGTHGLIDSETPRLSGLAFSMIDDQGQPQEGFLGLSDIYHLKLGSDLVVLSGCETALGREIRGEGLVGLTQGFLYAGAERVMASLWRVEDRATSELMSRFYGAMFRDGLPPAAALRSAQLAIRRDSQWQSSYFWAPFVLQGDWR